NLQEITHVAVNAFTPLVPTNHWHVIMFAIASVIILEASFYPWDVKEPGFTFASMVEKYHASANSTTVKKATGEIHQKSSLYNWTTYSSQVDQELRIVDDDSEKWWLQKVVSLGMAMVENL
ncbi:hypothetical protein HYDPIDRAFT_171307, partial [Hydnomerulius pinastri MD-312]